MRTQQIITVDTGCRRKSGEGEHSFFERVDQHLTLEVNAQQQKRSWMDWDLLSVSPTNKQGVFLTTWEYDPELHEDVKSDEESEQAMPSWQRGVFNEVFGGPSTVYYDGVSAYPDVHELKHGDMIRVNGDLFVLTEYYKDHEANVYFTSVEKMEQEEDGESRAGFVRTRGRGLYGSRLKRNRDYGRS